MQAPVQTLSATRPGYFKQTGVHCIDYAFAILDIVHKSMFATGESGITPRHAPRHLHGLNTGRKRPVVRKKPRGRQFVFIDAPLQEIFANGRIPSPRHNRGFGIVGQFRLGGQLHPQPEKFPHPPQKIRIVGGRRQHRTVRSGIPYRQQSHVLRHTAGRSRGYVVRLVIGKRKV